jgi:nucleotide-binding universal stress UspA family protein
MARSPIQRILVAIDSRESAAHALAVASSLATTLSAHIGLVHVIDPKLVGGETGVPAEQMWALLRRDGQGLLDTAAASIPAHPHPWKFLREGAPWKEIIRSAREWRADLIVVGTHGRSGLARLLWGSTAEGVVRHGPCPVVVVPPTAALGETSGWRKRPVVGRAMNRQGTQEAAKWLARLWSQLGSTSTKRSSTEAVHRATSGQWMCCATCGTSSMSA